MGSLDEAKIEEILRANSRPGDNDCIVWTGNRLPRGYGQFNFRNKKYFTHRVVAEIKFGAIDNLIVMHICDNPPCINPDHLKLGTQADNVKDRDNKGRNYNKQKTHCPQGHEYSLTCTDKSNKRKCKTCNRISARKQLKNRRHLP